MKRTIINSITREKITLPSPSSVELIYDGKPMLTETDTAGIITYANRKFCEMSGYTKQELLGATHNINRHPDMPHSAFENLWSIIKKDNEWHGYVKNLRKDGKFYWVDVYIEPRFNNEGKKIGYIASRKPISPKNLESIEKVYKEMSLKEQ